MATCECQNCDWQGDEDDTKPIKHLHQRVAPGEPVPVGECPLCGCLCRLSAVPQQEEPAFPTFTLTREEAALINKIVTRARKIVVSHTGRDVDPLELHMDITAAHANGSPLRLRDLLNADDVDFGHDVFGISRYLDRRTGKLTENFSPRYSASRRAAA